MTKIAERAYPNITPKAEEAIIALAKCYQSWDNFLDHKDCRYSPSLKEAIRQMSEQPIDTSELDAELANQDVDIARESRVLYHKLKTTMNKVDGMETNEKVQIFRTATSLLEKLLTLQEKASGIAQYEHFKNLVMETMDRSLTPVQVADFVEQLKQIEEG